MKKIIFFIILILSGCNSIKTTLDENKMIDNYYSDLLMTSQINKFEPQQKDSKILYLNHTKFAGKHKLNSTSVKNEICNSDSIVRPIFAQLVIESIDYITANKKIDWYDFPYFSQLYFERLRQQGYLNASQYASYSDIIYRADKK